jgi:hypothetical protein
MRGDAKRLEILVAEGVIVNIWRVHNDLATRVVRFALTSAGIGRREQ